MSISCLNDSSYPPIKQNLNLNAIKQMIEALRRLLVCVCWMSESNYIENLYEPSKRDLKSSTDTTHLASLSSFSIQKPTNV